MPMIARGTGAFLKRRILISGLSMTGKTWSLPTFIYGDHDYWDDEEHADACSFAEGKSMVILSCPGETGTLSIPRDTEHLKSFYFENASEVDRKTVAWGLDVMSDFDKRYKEVERNKPDIFFIDGAHNIYEIKFNIITGGQYFNGGDLRIRSDGGIDPYQAATFYSMAHTAFGNYLATWYDSPIPFIGVTTWEELQGSKTGMEAKSSIKDERFWWPALPGAMATRIVGRFDARLSARLEPRCYHPNCERSKRAQDHHVWQFFPKGNVMGVGIKGLRVTEQMMEHPYIHQSWTALQALLGKVR